MRWQTAALIAGGLWLLSRKASASARPAEERGSEAAEPPNYGETIAMQATEVRRAADTARRQSEEEARESAALYEAHRSDFDQPGPFPGRLVALICWRESRGRDVTTADKERGPMALMDGETRKAGGGDPHSLKDSVRMRQLLWAMAIKRYPQRSSGDQLAIGMLAQALGEGATGWIGSGSGWTPRPTSRATSGRPTTPGACGSRGPCCACGTPRSRAGST